MSLDWLRPPRPLLVLFAGVTLVPAAALVGLGWRFIVQDRKVERQQLHDRLEGAADRIAAGMARDLDAIVLDLRRWLAEPPASLDSGATVTRIGPKGVTARVGAPLVFVPAATPTAAGPNRETWKTAESLEYRQRDFVAAAEAFRALASSSHGDTRAGALVGLARNLRAIGRHDEALATYRSLQTLSTARVIDEPADLVGRFAECRLLAELSRDNELMVAATALGGDLARGRWLIDRPTYEAHTAELRTWTPVAPGDEEVAIAGAVEMFWNQRGTAAVPAASGRQSLWSNGRGVLVAWQPAGDEVLVFAAGAPYLERAWRPAWNAERVRVSLVDQNGRGFLGEPRAERVALRQSLDTGLPWDLRVASSADGVDSAAFSTRRRLLTVGLAVLVFLIPACGYVVARAVRKELAVARLQADFVSAVSHEFRTPLTSMAHLTERLQRDETISSDRRKQYYDVIARDTERLRRFCETLLDFGRMEAGAAPVHLQPADLVSVVTDIVNEFRTDRAAGQHEISVQPSGTVPPVRLDREAFARALWNLLDNAAKYSPDVAPITVEIGWDGRRAAVRVRDTGCGVPGDEHRLIFQQFVRGADSKGSGIKGTGVGLAIVDRIVRAHGGVVQLDSTVGKGSTFSVLLPVEEKLTS